MELTLIDQEITTETYSFDKLPYPLLNFLKRELIHNVATVALELVDIYTNTTILTDDLICERLKLIPIKSAAVDSLNFVDQCTCQNQGCSQCVLKYTLDVTATSKVALTSNYFIGENSDFKILSDIFICHMEPGQQLHLEAYAIKGYGLDHAKWQHCQVQYTDSSFTVEHHGTIDVEKNLKEIIYKLVSDPDNKFNQRYKEATIRLSQSF